MGSKWVRRVSGLCGVVALFGAAAAQAQDGSLRERLRERGEARVLGTEASLARLGTHRLTLRHDGKLATWNAGHCCGGARDDAVDDVGFVRALVAELKRRLPVDAARIHATGMSNGGMMAHRLACDAADLFASVAAVAGTDNTTACTPSRPIPVLHIHALDDAHVLYGGGAGPDAFRDPSKVTDFTSVPETITRWTRRNGCSAPPQRVLTVPGAWCERHDGCSGGAAVQLSQALSANDVMWDFFGGR
jgi:polyhydroxybutyrate depolymerase